MEKKRNKSLDKNIRLHEPCGLLGVPPESAVKIYVPASGAAVVIITGWPVIRSEDIKLPQ